MKSTINQRLKRLVQIVSLKLLLSALSFLLALYVFIAFTHEIFIEREQELDQNVVRFVSTFVTEEVYQVMQFFTFFGSSQFLFPAYLFLIGMLLLKNKKTVAIEVAIIGISSTVLLRLLKFLFRRSRPDSPLVAELHSYSFPSGHAMSSFVFCSLAIYVIWQSGIDRRWKWVWAILLVLLSFIVGISRIVLHVHYASDVICGFCIGYLWVQCSLWLQRKLVRKKIEPVSSDA